jgi:predicted DNA-binding protein
MEKIVMALKQKMYYIKELAEDTIQELDRQGTNVDAVRELSDDFVTKTLEELVLLQEAKKQLS